MFTLRKLLLKARIWLLPKGKPTIVIEATPRGKEMDISLHNLYNLDSELIKEIFEKLIDKMKRDGKIN